MTAKPGKLTAGAVRTVCRTTGASVDDQEMRELRPCFRRHHRADVGFDDLGIGRIGKTDERGETFYMGINRESGLIKCVAEYYVGCFSANAGEF